MLWRRRYSQRQKEEIKRTLDAYEEVILSCFPGVDIEPNLRRLQESLRKYHEVTPPEIPLPHLIEGIDEKLGVRV